MLLKKSRLPDFLKKWNLKPPANVVRLPKCAFDVESGEEADVNGGGHFSRVPKGYFAVYVGEEMRRFVVPLSYLNHSIFRVLLKKAEEEFGFSSNGGIRLPCESLLFEHILWLLKKKGAIVQNLELEAILGFYHEDGDKCSSSCSFSCFPFFQRDLYVALVEE